MKTMSRTQLIVYLAVAMPLLQNCGKARYQQVNGPPAQVAPARVPPASEPMGPMSVRPAMSPRPSATPFDSRAVPPLNQSGEQPPAVPLRDRELPPAMGALASPVPGVDWMDPSHYNPAGRPSAHVPKPRQSAPQPQPPPAACPPGTECFIGDYTQPRRLVTDKLDLVFVVDTSESIFKEREAAANGIDRFMSALPSDTDYRIGVIAAHGESTGLAGEFVRVGQEPAVLSSAELSREQIREALRAKLTGIRQDSEADGGELGLYSLDRAITGDKLVKSRAQGMFRHDAGLAVVFLSDENDICSLATHPNAKKDPNGKEIPAFKTYCEGRVGADPLYRKIVHLQAGGYDPAADRNTAPPPLLIAAIVYTDPETVSSKDESDKWSVENEVGYGYLDVVRMNNGIAVDLAHGDIPGALARIGQAARGKLALKTEFLIHESRKIDTETMCVLVDGREVAYSFDAERKQVNLSSGGAPGSKVEIFYCAEKTPSVQGRSGPRQDPLTRADSRDARETVAPSFIDPRCVTLRQRLGDR